MVAASVPYGCSLRAIWLACSLRAIWLQPPCHMVAASVPYGRRCGRAMDEDKDGVPDFSDNRYFMGQVELPYPLS